MTFLSPDVLTHAAARLMTETGRLADTEAELELSKMEQCARAFILQLKAIHALELHNQRQEETQTSQKYSRYEDLPPLMPEDRDRLKRELIRLLSPRRIGAAGPNAGRLSKAPDTEH